MKLAGGAALLLAAWTGAALADPAPITFNGVDFAFHHVGRINNGWAAYYAPHGQDPEQSHDEIIVNYLDKTDGQGHSITAKGMAELMLGSIDAQGGKLIAPFAAPDPVYQGRLSYVMTFYYVYPRDKNGDIWRARIMQGDDRAFGVMFKHRIDGTDADDIDARIIAWLKDNMSTIRLDTIALPPEPSHG